jgi:hypothetical protein
LIDILLRLDISTRENLGDINKLAVEGVTGKLDGFVEGSEIGYVVADTGVEVVKGDLRYIEGIGGLEGDGTSVITGVGLKDSLEVIKLFPL